MWGPGAQGGFQNALAAGLQMGQIARQNQQQDMFMRQREAQIQQQGAQFEAEQAEALRKQDAARVEGELTAAALGGNEEALTQLATRNFDKWKSISGELKAKAVGEAELYGNAALDLLQVPYEQRRGRFIAYAQQFPELGDKIQEVAFLPAEQQETALRAALAEAKMIGKLHEMERPQAFNVGPGEGRYERNPRTGEINTIVQPNYGQAPSFSPAPGNAPAPVAEKTIGGTTYVQDANGDWYVKGGAGGNASGNFR